MKTIVGFCISMWVVLMCLMILAAQLLLR